MAAKTRSWAIVSRLHPLSSAIPSATNATLGTASNAKQPPTNSTHSAPPHGERSEHHGGQHHRAGSPEQAARQQRRSGPHSCEPCGARRPDAGHCCRRLRRREHGEQCAAFSRDALPIGWVGFRSSAMSIRSSDRSKRPGCPRGLSAFVVGGVRKRETSEDDEHAKTMSSPLSRRITIRPRARRRLPLPSAPT